jgi:superfamily II DNA or RNA helicase
MKELTPTTGNIGYFVATEFGPNFFRFGMTKNGRSPYERWSEDGDYRKCGNPAQFDHEFYELEDKLDHDIHNLLKKCPGIRVASHDIVRSPEVFECEFGLKHAKELVESLIAVVVGKAQPIRKPLDPRPYQQNFVDQFKSTTGDFCLFAKCRSGKSAMTLLAATQCDYRSVLVASYRTSAANSWRDDAVTYTPFYEWDVIDLSSKNWEEQIVVSQKANRRQLLVSTVQRQNEKFGYIENVRELYPNGLDLLALDECHIGGESDQFAKLKAGIRYGRLLEISGTAYKASWHYDKVHKFVWGYVEEQRAKREGYSWAKHMPSMELIMVKYDSQKLQEIYKDEPDAMKCLFSVEEGEWKDRGSIESFIGKYFAHGSQVHKSQKLLHGSRHILMALPSMEACALFEKTFNKTGLPWTALDITSGSGNEQADILEHIKNHPQGTVCLTRWANVVGVTVPQWDTVINAAEGASAEFWVQLAFRGGSIDQNVFPEEDRRKSWRVIDFVPERSLESILEMVSTTSAAQDDTRPDSAPRTFLEFADVFEFDNGLVQLDYEQLLSRGFLGATTAQAECRAAMQEVVVGDNLEVVAWAFEGLDKVKAETIVSETINENGTSGQGNLQLQRTNQLTSDEREKLRRETLAAVKAAIGKFGAVIANGLLYGKDLSTLPQLLSYDKFELYTGCSPHLIELVIDNNWYPNIQSLHQRISRIHFALASTFRCPV